MIRTAILTVNDAVASGEQQDGAVAVIREALASGPYVEVDYQVVAREKAIIRSKLRLWSDGDYVDLVLTTGGTGLALRDRTPEATQEVIERAVPGIAQLMRLTAMRKDRHVALSRAVAGMRRQTLIVNLPDLDDHVREGLGALIDILPDAVATMTANGAGAVGNSAG